MLNEQEVEERWKLKRTQQCTKCPWRKHVSPRDIPNGYSETKHRALQSTIAHDPPSSILNPTHAMACHESHDAHCVGWIVNQMGPGNNIGLRIRLASCANVGESRLAGEQHATFTETLPR